MARRFASLLRRRWCALWLLIAAGVAAPAGAASLESVRVAAHADFTRIVLDTSRSLAAELVRPDARRLVLDVDAAPAEGLAAVGAGLVRTVAIERTPGGTRLTLALAAPARVAGAFALAPGRRGWHRYVVDLEPDPAIDPPVAASDGSVAARDETPPAAAAVTAEPLRVRVPRPRAHTPRRRPVLHTLTPKRRPPVSRPVVVVDAGHGGRDPGAIAPSGLEEKAVTLAVARALAARLRAAGAIDVVLTRDRDTGLALAERLAIAAANEADLFVSLHADSLPAEPTIRGASVYTLSAQPSDPEAARKAREENAADERLEVIASAPDETVRTILTSLMRTSTDRRSETFARMVTADLAAVTPLLQRPHRSANFVVLRSLNTPSVLVELGYLSNAVDAAALADPAHREALAAALFRAVTAHFASG